VGIVSRAASFFSGLTGSLCAAPCSSFALAILAVTEPAPFSLDDFQSLIRKMYFEKDQARGIDGTFMWLMEEVGELAAALREGTSEEQAAEFADVLAWLTTIANVAGVDMTEAVRRKYGAGCPGCGQFACVCDDAGKP
jgi:NTP pyrophosphatase (non-canonical NTP hydrolase)